MTEQKKNRILIVDDDPTFIQLAKSMLSKENYEVETAGDGDVALAKVKELKPHLIVLDIMMPNMNGYDVCRTLKFDSPYKNIPILILTVRDQEIDSRIGKLMGIHYLQKPLNREVFLATVKQTLK